MDNEDIRALRQQVIEAEQFRNAAFDLLIEDRFRREEEIRGIQEAAAVQRGMDLEVIQNLQGQVNFLGQNLDAHRQHVELVGYVAAVQDRAELQAQYDGLVHHLQERIRVLEQGLARCVAPVVHHNPHVQDEGPPVLVPMIWMGVPPPVAARRPILAAPAPAPAPAPGANIHDSFTRILRHLTLNDGAARFVLNANIPADIAQTVANVLEEAANELEMAVQRGNQNR